MDTSPYCVNVREYLRICDGETKTVQRHKRRRRRWYRRPCNAQF
jgi:hypothetical protein